ncbi:MAG: hypothetical protein ABIG08_03325 [bacterium]
MAGKKGFLTSLIISAVLAGLFFLLGLEAAPEKFQLQELFGAIDGKDVVVVFNSGGWGNTPLEKAEDFRSVVEGIQETLAIWGYNSIVVSYERTEDTFLGKIAGAKDFLNSFNFSAGIFAKDLELLSEKMPGKKIIIAGLSNGGAFVSKTYEKISQGARESIYAIAAGIPFWAKSFSSENLLQLDNSGRDSLARGDVGSLLLSFFKVPNRQISQASHWYSWDSLDVGPQIESFLADRFY